MKDFRLSLFPNTYKNNEKQPDARGNLQIPLSVINDLYQGLSLGTIVPKAGYGDSETYVELRAAAWKSDGSLTANGKQRPAISITIDSPAETANYEASRLAKEATSEFPNPQPSATNPFASSTITPGWALTSSPQQPAPVKFDDSMPF